MIQKINKFMDFLAGRSTLTSTAILLGLTMAVMLYHEFGGIN